MVCFPIIVPYPISPNIPFPIPLSSHQHIPCPIVTPFSPFPIPHSQYYLIIPFFIIIHPLSSYFPISLYNPISHIPLLYHYAMYHYPVSLIPFPLIPFSRYHPIFSYPITIPLCLCTIILFPLSHFPFIIPFPIPTSVRNEGGGVGGVRNPPYLHRTLAFVLSKGTQGGSLKDPPPPLNIKMSFMNCFKLLSITRNKTGYKDKGVTLKTLPVA